MPAAVMLLCLPLLVFALLAGSHVGGWRVALLAASALWGAYLTAICEILGAARLLTAPWLFSCWTALALGLEAYLFWRIWRGGWLAPALTVAYWRRAWERLPWPLWVTLGGVCVILALTLVTAIAAPPNTPDTMTYHLARVMRWIQDASLAPFSSHQMSQDIQPPWAELTLLNLHLLSGSDWLDGLVQWGSFAGCGVGVSLIAARLGAGARGQVFTTVYAATIPMAIVQASSVQNDLVVAYWLVCVAYFLLAYRAASDTPARLRAALFAGLSLGLAALTKSLSYVDALPFLLVFAVWAIRALRWRAWQPFAALALLALALNLGFYARNVIAFGAPLGVPTTTQIFSNAAYTPDVFLLNLARNTAVEFGGPSHEINALVTRQVDNLLRAIGLDPNDPRATMAGSPPFQLRGEKGLWLSDGYTTNTIHLLLALLAGVVCLATPALRQRHALMGYLLALAGAFALFSFYLRWQAGSNRLMLGLFVLAAPLAGATLETLSQRVKSPSRFPGALTSALITLLLLTTTPWLLTGQSRPLIGARSVLTTPRVDQYFAASPPAEAGYVGAVEYIKGLGCHQVGFFVSGPQDRAGYTTGAPAWEYPLWALLNEPGGGAYRIADVLVTNATASLASATPNASFQPCAVFAILQPAALQSTLFVSGRDFHLTWHAPGFSNALIAVYTPDSAALLAPAVRSIAVIGPMAVTVARAGDGEGEDAAVAGLALHPDLTAMVAHDFPADEQAQPQADA